MQAVPARIPVFLSISQASVSHAITGATWRQMDSRTKGQDSLARARLLPNTFWEGPALVRP